MVKMIKDKYRIAFTGVFDLENFGDQLFPLVFSHEMQKRGLNIELVLFSPIAGKQVYGTGNEVYALIDLEKMHLEIPFDVIVVGGGEIAHFVQTGPRLPSGESADYPISQTWVIPSLMAYKYNIKLVWNCPGTNSNKFPEPYRWMMQALYSSIDYLSVRNQTSKEILIDCGVPSENIREYPDTAFMISDVLNLPALQAIREEIIPFKENYVVFHTNINISDEGIVTVVDSLNKLKQYGYEVVLLPLAYTHRDDEILTKINLASNNMYYLFDRRLSIPEILSILACSELYIGASFHGAITSMAYGGRAIAFDLSQNKKTKDIFQIVNMEKYYIYETSKLNTAIKEILAERPEVVLDEIRNILKEHFDNIYQKVIDNKTSAKHIEPFIIGYLKGLNAFWPSIISSNELEEAREYICKLHEEIREKNNAITYQNEVIKLREAGLLEQFEYITFQENSVKTQQEEIKTQQEEIKTQQEEIKTQQEEIKTQQELITAMTNTFTWRTRGILLNLFKKRNK